MMALLLLLRHAPPARETLGVFGAAGGRSAIRAPPRCFAIAEPVAAGGGGRTAVRQRRDLAAAAALRGQLHIRLSRERDRSARRSR